MRVYRVFPYSPDAADGEPGHASYVPPAQAGGRLDNPELYTTRYFAESPAGAVAERFGELAEWSPVMFELRTPLRLRLTLATFELAPETRLLDLDNAQALVDRSLRPTQIVRRDLRVTQAWARRIHAERRTPRGPRAWDGVRWWSWYRPEWPVLGVWAGEAELLELQRLHLDHPAVRDAAVHLGRTVK